MALTEVAETTLQETSTKSRTKQRKRSGLLSGTGAPLQKIRLYLFENLLVKTENQTKDYSLGFIFPGNCVKVQKEIKAIFTKQTEKVYNASKSFKACFGNYAISALFRKEKKPGALISRSKL